jgi:hypothetical protein
MHIVERLTTGRSDVIAPVGVTSSRHCSHVLPTLKVLSLQNTSQYQGDKLLEGQLDIDRASENWHCVV